MKTIKLGTRGSDLALWQTEHVASLLKQTYPNITTETVIISTRGDQVLDTPLPLVGGKGLFTAELEAALRQHEIDFAVHSLKDLPTDDPKGLTVGAIPARANPSDVLVSRDRYTLETLPQGAIVGTSSRRRAAQLLALRPDIEIKDIRGNINTRIRKGLEGSYDAIVLAFAGIDRLKLPDVPFSILPFEQMLPAPGQGALGVQCRDEAESIALLAPITDQATIISVTAERAFLKALGGGCSVPIAAHASLKADGMYTLEGRVYSLDGQRKIQVQIPFDGTQAHETGMQLAQMAISQGASDILS